MGWIAVSAEGSQGKGSPKRNVFFTDTGIKVNCEKPTTCCHFIVMFESSPLNCSAYHNISR